MSLEELCRAQLERIEAVTREDPMTPEEEQARRAELDYLRNQIDPDLVEALMTQMQVDDMFGLTLEELRAKFLPSSRAPEDGP